MPLTSGSAATYRRGGCAVGFVFCLVRLGFLCPAAVAQPVRWKLSLRRIALEHSPWFMNRSLDLLPVLPPAGVCEVSGPVPVAHAAAPPAALPVAAAEASARQKGRYSLVTLGCPKNLVDSERMAGLLASRAISWCASPAGRFRGRQYLRLHRRRPARNRPGRSARCGQLKPRGSSAGSSWPAAWPSGKRRYCSQRYPGVDQLVGVSAATRWPRRPSGCWAGWTSSGRCFAPPPPGPCPTGTACGSRRGTWPF